jgi:hypothetical protein
VQTITNATISDTDGPGILVFSKPDGDNPTASNVIIDGISYSKFILSTYSAGNLYTTLPYEKSYSIQISGRCKMWKYLYK